MTLSVRAGLAGVAAAAVAVGVAEMIAVWTGPLSAPLLAVGGVVVDHVPAAVKDIGVRVFGVHDKTALLVGTAILLAGYAYGVGAMAVRSWRLALGGIGVFSVIGVAAAVTRHDAGAFAALPSLLGGLLATWVLAQLLELADPPGAGTSTTRGGVAAGGLTSGGTAAAWAGAGETTVAGAGAGGAVTDGGGSGAGDRAPGGAGGGVTRQVSPAAGDDRGPDAAGAAPAGTGPDAYLRGVADSDQVPDVRQTALAEGDRRRFLKYLAVAAGVAGVSGMAGRWLTSRKAVNAARQEVVLPVPRQVAPPLPAGVQAPGATPFVVSNRDFYRIDTALYPPQVDPATWQLRIHGMVRNPITITWEQLLRRPMIERYITLACVSNEVGGELVGNARWLGTPIRELLDEADPLPDADQVIQRSGDGWTCGTPTAVLRDGRDALLAVGMNGVPLPVEHGFPVRMVVPGLYGYVSACKWITEIELSRFADFDAYWVPRGWARQAPIKTQSRIDTPRDGASRPAGTVVVAGVAWAQPRGVSRVELQVDGGAWQEATLAAAVTGDTWRQWSYPWPAAAGRHTLRVRATDRDGQTQTGTPAAPAPDGATGWHSITVEVE